MAQPHPDQDHAHDPDHDHDQIRTTIASVAVVQDTKDYARLGQLLTEDCVVNYPWTLGRSEGLAAVAARLQKATGHLRVEHVLASQTVRLTGADTATASTVWSVSHWLGDASLFAEARTDDKLVRVVVVDGDGDGGGGGGGCCCCWRIRERLCVAVGEPRGDYTIIH